MILECLTPVQHLSHESCFGTKGGQMLVLAALVVRGLNPVLWAPAQDPVLKRKGV